MSAPRPPWVVWLGLAVVLAAAAVLSFDALRGLALAVAIPAELAWLLPLAVDAGAAVSCSVWLGGRTHPDAARFAGRMTWALLAVTVVGNAAQLGMHAHGVVPPWWVAVAVGSIPPAVVGAAVHLVVLLARRPAAVVEQAPGMADHDADPLAQAPADAVDPAPHPVGPPGVAERVAELAAAGAGRRRVARELRIPEHQARALLAEVKAAEARSAGPELPADDPVSPGPGDGLPTSPTPVGAGRVPAGVGGAR